jgi:purine-binding chemotaxis protein CheW
MGSRDVHEPVATTQLLSFVLDSELFAARIDRVREILDRTDMTRIPRMPDYMRGALNVRGEVIPVVDLRVKFGLPAVEYTLDTCVVLIEVAVDGEMTVLGALVDAVRDVFEVEESALSNAPRMGTKLNTEFIEGVAHCDDELIIVLDLDRVLSHEEVITLRDTVSGSDADAPDVKRARRKKKADD